MDVNQIWTSVLQSMENNINSTVGYKIHVKDAVTPVLFENSVFLIAVPMSINKNMIELN